VCGWGAHQRQINQLQRDVDSTSFRRFAIAALSYVKRHGSNAQRRLFFSGNPTSLSEVELGLSLAGGSSVAQTKTGSPNSRSQDFDPGNVSDVPYSGRSGPPPLVPSPRRVELPPLDLSAAVHSTVAAAALLHPVAEVGSPDPLAEEGEDHMSDNHSVSSDHDLMDMGEGWGVLREFVVTLCKCFVIARPDIGCDLFHSFRV
jgi:hypothetical protein